VDKYELKLANAILAEEKHLPLYSELVTNYKVEYLAGGATQNSIRAAQWLLQSPLATVFVGCVGKDEYAKKLKAAAEGAGVRALYLEDDNTPTGTCAVLIRDKERTMVANLAAANKYKPEHFHSEQVQAAVQKAQVFYSSGFFLTVSAATALELAQHAAKTNKTYVTNLSAPFIIDFFWDQLNAVLPYTDIIFGNEHEAATLGKKLGLGEDLKAIAQHLSGLPKENKSRPRTVIFTQGGSPTLVSVGGEPVQEFSPISIKKEEIVDTNGAGDFFVGGFLAYLVQGKPLADCIKAGHYCAWECIRRSGANYPEKPNFSA
jgi:adenosine kinase